MKHRVFLGIPLPENLTALVSPIQASLPDPQMFKLEKLDKLHLTLNFMGRLDSELLSQLTGSVLPNFFRSQTPFSLQFFHLETLYRRHEPSLVYLGVGPGQSELIDLYSQLCELLSTFKIPQPSRFLPHLTIARTVKSDPTTTKSLLGQVDQENFTPFPPFTVDRVFLYTSHLSKKGSTYQRLATFPFRQAEMS